MNLGQLTKTMGFFVSMFGNILLLKNHRTLEAEPIRGQGGRNRVVAHAFANLWENGDIIIYSAQNSLVVLNTGICSLLILVQKTLHMFYMLC